MFSVFKTHRTRVVIGLITLLIYETGTHIILPLIEALHYTLLSTVLPNTWALSAVQFKKHLGLLNPKLCNISNFDFCYTFIIPYRK
jgi:hypothetical protein